MGFLGRLFTRIDCANAIFPRRPRPVLKPGFRICLETASRRKERQTNKALTFISFVTTSASHKRRAGILTCCPLAAVFTIALGPPNPPSIYVAEEPLDLRGTGFSPDMRLLMPTFSLPIAPPCLTARLHRNGNALLPHLMPRAKTPINADRVNSYR